MILMTNDELAAVSGVVMPAKSGDRCSEQEHLDAARLTTDILRLNECQTIEQVNTALSVISHTLGFDAFLYRGRFQTGGTRFVEQVASNHSPSWRRRYEEAAYAQIDPTVAHACISLSPLVWSDDMYVGAQQHAFRKEAQRHGLLEGMTLPVHSRNGDVALLSLSLSRSDEAARRHVHGMLMWGALLASLTHEAMRRIVKDSGAFQAPKLTKREIEVLQWIADGKSNWEISKVIDISEHGVSHHVRNILLKFDVTSRHQAVAQAVVFGLLQNSYSRA